MSVLDETHVHPDIGVITTAKEIPEWLREMEFCHTVLPDESSCYCGATVQDPGSIHNGNPMLAICDGCGRPNCPRCAQILDLDDRLEDS